MKNKTDKAPALRCEAMVRRLGFVIEDRGGMPVLAWTGSGCRPAHDTEVKLWNAVLQLERSRALMKASRKEYMKLYQQARNALPFSWQPNK